MLQEQNGIRNDEKQIKYALLSKDQAEQRSMDIDNCQYTLDLIVENEIIMGMILINFTCYSDHIKLDFCGQQIQSVKVNNNEWSLDEIVKNWRKHQLSINTIKGENCIMIAFSIQFSESEFGLIKYTQNQSTYIISLFCPNYCHSCFPCFDQPDIKAKIKLQLTCPKEWLAISNMNPNLIEQCSETQNQWNFATTPKISLYLFSLNMGQWKKITKVLNQGIQMNLYTEQDKYITCLNSSILIQKCMEEGFNYYQSLFNIPFPFEKYDLIFCSFYFSGMEHPGAVLISRNMIQNRFDSNQLTKLFLLLLHELSHMWFGNLVTMKWWNDLWLNEAFAVYISYEALASVQQQESLKCYKFNDTKIHYLLYKQNGVNLDINSHSHPIEMKIEDANQGLQAFDSITYNKGSAVLSALVKLIGFNEFIEIVKQYLDKFKWRNATTNDLFDLIQQHSKVVDIERWRREFIQQNGINVIEIIKQDQQSILKQSSISGNAIRQHYMNILLIKEDNQMEEKQIMMTKDCHYLCESKDYSAAILNYTDDAYCISTMDDKSLSFILSNFNQLNISNQIRVLILNNIFQMTYILGTFKVKYFLEFVLQSMNQDVDAEVLNFMIEKVEILFMNLNVEQQLKFGPIIFDKLYLLISLNIELKEIIHNQIGNFAFDQEHIHQIYEILTLHQKSNRSLMLLGRFLDCLFYKKHLLNQDHLQSYELFWSTLKSYNPNFVIRQNAAAFTLEELQQYFISLLQNTAEYNQMENMFKGINNPYSLIYDQYLDIYYSNIKNLCACLDQHKILIVLNEGFPRQGDFNIQLQILNELEQEFPNLNFTLNKLKQRSIQRQKIQQSFD
ncbi:unnamed protein product [Paramecium pentaurelia]|uniref:Aminopeptidase n=1 Tax=Paramecium pentaurelia TaxID=43138 RepID=A0A8S1XRT8_9CILI|nr:unnamed protein product [Paramecium pentaurelia]